MNRRNGKSNTERKKSERDRDRKSDRTLAEKKNLISLDTRKPNFFGIELCRMEALLFNINSSNVRLGVMHRVSHAPPLFQSLMVYIVVGIMFSSYFFYFRCNDFSSSSFYFFFHHFLLFCFVCPLSVIFIGIYTLIAKIWLLLSIICKHIKECPSHCIFIFVFFCSVWTIPVVVVVVVAVIIK